MYDTKDKTYFKQIRTPLLDLIPEENRNGNVLEVGAAAGDTMIYAKENGYANKIFGIELTEVPDSNQNNSNFEKFIIGNIENLNIPFQNNFFDVIIMGDVLEHLVDPYTVVNNMKKYLKPNGVVIASIPNVRNLKTFRNIYLRKSFNYSDQGIFDKTHLRFFTKKDTRALFEDEGYYVLDVISNLKFRKSSVATKNKLTFGLFEEFWTKQYFAIAKKI